MFKFILSINYTMFIFTKLGTHCQVRSMVRTQIAFIRADVFTSFVRMRSHVRTQKQCKNDVKAKIIANTVHDTK